MTALHQWPGQEAVLGNKVSQRRKTVEAGIGTVVQNRRTRRLQQEVQDVADDSVAEDRPADLGEHRRISGRKRNGMSGVAEPGHTGQQQPKNRSHHGQHPARVRAFRLTKQVDRVGDRLDPGQRRAAVGESPQYHQDCRAHHQAIALMHRDRPVKVGGVVRRQTPKHLTYDPDHDHQREHADKPVRWHRECPARLPQSTQVEITENEHRTDRDFQAVGAQHRYRRRHRHGAGRTLDRHGDHVVDQQRCGRDLRYPRPEILPGHDVRTARPACRP